MCVCVCPCVHVCMPIWGLCEMSVARSPEEHIWSLKLMSQVVVNQRVAETQTRTFLIPGSTALSVYHYCLTEGGRASTLYIYCLYMLFTQIGECYLWEIHVCIYWNLTITTLLLLSSDPVHIRRRALSFFTNTSVSIFQCIWFNTRVYILTLMVHKFVVLYLFRTAK